MSKIIIMYNKDAIALLLSFEMLVYNTRTDSRYKWTQTEILLDGERYGATRHIKFRIDVYVVV